MAAFEVHSHVNNTCSLFIQQAPAHNFHHTKLALERSFGMRLEEVFDSIETLPVASGSIGQIHRATLSTKGAAVTGCSPGQVVAVKVRPPVHTPRGREGEGGSFQLGGRSHCQ